MGLKGMLSTRNLCDTTTGAATQSLLSSQGPQSPQHPRPGAPAGLGDSLEEDPSSPQTHLQRYSKGRDSAPMQVQVLPPARQCCEWAGWTKLWKRHWHQEGFQWSLWISHVPAPAATLTMHSPTPSKVREQWPQALGTSAASHIQLERGLQTPTRDQPPAPPAAGTQLRAHRAPWPGRFGIPPARMETVLLPLPPSTELSPPRDVAH